MKMNQVLLVNRSKPLIDALRRRNLLIEISFPIRDFFSVQNYISFLMI